MARPEQVDEAVRRDRLGAPLAGRLDRVRLGLGEALEDGAGGRDPRQAERGRAVAAAISTPPSGGRRLPATGLLARPCVRGSRR